MAISAISNDLQVCPILIDGKHQPSRGTTHPQINPATGQQSALIPYCTAEEVGAAIASAQRAFPAWSSTPVLQRARIMFKYRQILEAHQDELASLMTEEHGKTRAESLASLGRGLECVEFAAGVPTLMMGEALPRVGADVDTVSTRESLGVCAGITPFNFPLMVPLWMFPMAIACGNTFVLKPSERVPRSAVRAAELLYEAGLPEGVLNVVHGDKVAVDALLTDPRVRAVSFVGSSHVAKYIYSTAAAHGKRVQAMGGAKNHSVVMPDCNLKAAVDAVMSSSFGCAGERCVATSIVVAVGDIGDKLIAELRKAADAMRVGPGDAPRCDMGPLVTKEHRDRVLKYIDIGEKEGARIARDGRNDDIAKKDDGYYVGATIFDDVKPGMRIAKEEIFGPVLSIIRAKDLDEALQIVNGSEHGNASSIYTRSGETAKKFTAAVQTGMVGVNLGVPAPVAIFPFAGWKNSFFGDSHALGKDAVHFYTETKVVTSRWPE